MVLVFLVVSPLPQIYRLCICVLEVTVVDTLWACVTWDRYTLWWWDCPGTSRVHCGKGNACYPFCSHAEDVVVMKSDSQFPGMVHEEDLHGDQGCCCTRGKVTPTRRGTARETSPHRTPGLFTMHIRHL